MEDRYFIDLTTPTNAQKAVRALGAAGIKSGVGKTTQAKKGCSYGVYISRNNLGRAGSALKKAGIRVRGK